MIVRYITRKNGEEIPFRFGQGVFVHLADMEGIPAVRLQKELFGNIRAWPIGRYYRLIHLAMRDGARKAGTHFDLSLDDVMDMFEEEPEVLQQFLGALTEAQPQAKKKRTAKVVPGDQT